MNSFSVLPLLTNSFGELFHFHFCLSMAIDYIVLLGHWNVHPIIFFMIG